MSRHPRIGGAIDAAGYRFLAELHRPDADGIRKEALRLHEGGLAPRDIAQALKTDLAQILEWLHGPQP